MVITKSLNGTEETFKVEGRLDTQAAPALLDELEQMDDHVDSLVFDFSELEDALNIARAAHSRDFSHELAADRSTLN